MKKRIILLYIVFCTTVLSGYYYYRFIKDKKKIVIQEFVIIKSMTQKQEETYEIPIYLADESKEFLLKQSFKIANNLSKEETVKRIFDRIKYDSKIVPINSEVLDLFFEEKDLYINLNAEFISQINTPEQELLLVYSIVNSLIELDFVNRVKILIENKEKQEIGKYIKGNDFFIEDLLLVKGEKK